MTTIQGVTQKPVLLAEAESTEQMDANKIVAMAKSEGGYEKVNKLAAQYGITLTDNVDQIPRMKSWLINPYSGHSAVLAELINLMNKNGVKVKDTGDEQPALINITARVKDGGFAGEVEFQGLGSEIYKPRLAGDPKKIETALMGGLISVYVENGGSVSGKTIPEMFKSAVVEAKKKAG